MEQRTQSVNTEEKNKTKVKGGREGELIAQREMGESLCGPAHLSSCWPGQQPTSRLVGWSEDRDVVGWASDTIRAKELGSRGGSSLGNPAAAC